MSESTRTLLLTPMSLVESRRQEFLDSGCLIPIGAPTIFSGRGAVGKSTLALDYAARVSNGTLEGRYLGEPRTVLLIQHEDDPATQVKPRLIAAGANLDNILTLTVREVTDGVESSDVPYLTQDMAKIREAVEETNAALILIDPLTSSVGGDLHKVQDVRRALNPLGALAQDYSLAVICLMHVRKGQAAAADKTSGSHAFRDAARSLLIFAHDEETGNRVVTVDKSSYSDTQGSSFAFNLISVDVPTDDGNLTSVAKVELLGATDVSVSDIWNREVDTGDGGEGSEAQSWLLNHLTDRGGKAKAADIKRAATGDGFIWRTIQRAGTKLCEKSSTGFQGEWMWTLKDDTSNTKDDKGDNTETPVTYEETVSPMELTCRICHLPLHESQASFGTHPTCGEEALA